MEEENSNTVGLVDKKPAPNYRGIKAMPYIIGNEAFEKLGAIGTLSNLLVYLTTIFNMKTITAATMLTVFTGTSNLATLIGAILSDTYFGRYSTLAFSSIIASLGLLMIDLTAVFKKLHPPQCGAKQNECEGATPFQMSFLIMGFGLLMVGSAGIRPCNFAFGADQFNPNTESGKRGMNSYFNWYFFTYTFAQLVALTVIVYIQTNVSWSIGLAIPAAFMMIGSVLFFMGSKIYVKVEPHGSPIVDLVQVIVAAIRKRGLKVQDPQFGFVHKFMPSDSINSRLPHTNQFRFLDKATIIAPDDEIKADGSAENPWRLSTQQQVEEVKCILRVIPIWTSAIIYHVPVGLVNTYVVFQALQSDRQLGSTHFKIPASSYTLLLMISYTIFIPVYDRIIVPFLEKKRGQVGGITILTRIGIGMGLSVLTMIAAAIVEYQRREIALTKPTIGFVPRRGDISSMSGLWQIIPLSLGGFAEAFATIGETEFYYKQFPENMRSVAGSLTFCSQAMSSYLSSFLISIVHQMTRNETSSDWLAEDLNKGRLDYFYYMVAALGTINLTYFLACAKWYKYKGSEEFTKEVNCD